MYQARLQVVEEETSGGEYSLNFAQTFVSLETKRRFFVFHEPKLKSQQYCSRQGFNQTKENYRYDHNMSRAYNPQFINVML